MRPEIMRQIERGTAITATVIALGGCAAGDNPDSIQGSLNGDDITLPSVDTVPDRPLPSVVRLPQTTLPSVESVDNESTAAEASAVSNPECSFRKVAPGKYFNDNNRADVADGLTALKQLKNHTLKLTLHNTRVLGELVYGTYKDPLYATRANTAVSEIKKGNTFTASQFYNADPKFNACPPNDKTHQTIEAARRERRQLANVGWFVFSEAAGETFNNAGWIVKNTYAAAKKAFKEELAELQKSP